MPKKNPSKMSAADRKSYAYANSQQKYEESVGKIRAAQDKVRTAKELTRKAADLSRVAASERGGLNIKTATFTGPSTRKKADQMVSRNNENLARIDKMENTNAASLKGAVRAVREGDAARARVAAKKKKK